MRYLFILIYFILVGCGTNNSPKIDDGFTYSYLSVPKDYTKTDGEKVEIYYLVHKATKPEKKIGVLFFNFGGPGNNAAASLRGLFNKEGEGLPSMQSLIEHFDLVGMDPRGTGKSAFALELTECAQSEIGCEKIYEKIAPYMGTNTILEDMEQLRIHLGEEKISYLGYSYGTRLGSLYANSHPEHVRALVLDSPMSPLLQNLVTLSLEAVWGDKKVMEFRLSLSQNINRESRLEEIFAARESGYVANDNERVTKAEIERMLDTLIATEWEERDKAIFEATLELLDNNNAKPLKLALLNEEKPSADELRIEAMFKSVVCTDESLPQTLIEIQAKKQDFLSSSAIFGVRRYEEATRCADWKLQRDPIPLINNMDSVLQLSQVLLIASELDTNTPYIWALAMKDAFGSAGKLLTLENIATHGFSYFRQLECVDKLTTEYLLAPDFPIKETSCDATQSK